MQKGLGLYREMQSFRSARQLGLIDIAGFGVFDNAAIVKNPDGVVATGWAVHLDRGAPVDQVQIMIDDVPFGFATLAITRTDVATFYNRPDFRLSGWQFILPFTATQGITPGPHHLSAVARDQMGKTFALRGSHIIEVPKDQTVLPFTPLGYIALPTTELRSGAQITLTGWVLDPSNEANVPTIEIRCKNQTLGVAKVVLRPDLVSAFAKETMLRAGWQAEILLPQDPDCVRFSPDALYVSVLRSQDGVRKTLPAPFMP